MLSNTGWVSERSIFDDNVNQPPTSKLLKRAFLDRSLPDVLLSSDPNISHSLLPLPDLSLIRSSRTTSSEDLHGHDSDAAGKDRAVLECTLCKAAYTQPKLLPCFHTFCRACIDAHIPAHSLAAACPKCSLYFILPELGTVDLPDNVFFQRIASYCASSNQKHDLLSSLPTLHSSPLFSSQLALEAGQKVGDETKIKSSYDAKTKLASKLFSRSMELLMKPPARMPFLQNSKDTIFENSDPLTCHHHGNRQAFSYCSTCEIRTCDFCNQMEHHDHDIKTSVEMRSVCREELGRLLEATRKRRHLLTNTKDYVFWAVSNLERNYKETGIKLNEHHTRLMRLLQQKHEENISYLSSLFQRRQVLLARNMQRVNARISGINLRDNLLTSVLLHDREEEVLICAKEFADEDLGEETQEVLLPGVETYFGLCYSEFDALARQLEQVKGLETSLPISDSDIKISNPSDYLAGLIIGREAHIVLKFSESVARIIGDKPLVTLLQSRISFNTRCIIPRLDYAADPFSASLIFTPSILGPGLVDVTFCGQPLTGSPFAIKVLEKEVVVTRKIQRAPSMPVGSRRTPVNGAAQTPRVSRPVTPIGRRQSAMTRMSSTREFECKSDDNITSVSACQRPKTNLTRSKPSLSIRNKPLTRSQPLNTGVKYVISSTFKTRLGSRGRNKGEFLNVQGVAVLKNQNHLAATDPNNHCVQVFDRSTGVCVLKFSRATPGGQACHLGVPAGVITLKNGNFVVSDYENGCVCVFAADGRFLDKFGKLQSPKGMAIDKSGKTLAVVDTKGRCVQLFQVGSWKHLEQIGSKTSDQLVGPHFCAFSPNGELVISDYNNGKVKVFNKVNGEYKLKLSFGADGKIKAPTGLVIDAKANIIVADWDSSMIQVYNSSGEYVSAVDTFSDPLLKPQGLSLTTDGHLVVADSANHCLKLFHYESPEPTLFF